MFFELSTKFKILFYLSKFSQYLKDLELVLPTDLLKFAPWFNYHLNSGYYALFNNLIDLFIAGMETTSSSLLWTFFYLLHHPQVQKRVHQELDEVTPSLLINPNKQGNDLTCGGIAVAPINLGAPRRVCYAMKWDESNSQDWSGGGCGVHWMLLYIVGSRGASQLGGIF